MENTLPELNLVSYFSTSSTVISRGYDENLLLLGNSVFCPTGCTHFNTSFSILCIRIKLTISFLGSSTPLLALPGYYTVNGNSTTRSSQVSCPIGAYCLSGIIRDCPAGRYGRAERLMNATCSGPCHRCDKIIFKLFVRY